MATKPETTVQDDVSTFINMKPPDILSETWRQNQVYKTRSWCFQTIFELLWCLKQIRAQTQSCYSITLKNGHLKTQSFNKKSEQCDPVHGHFFRVYVEGNWLQWYECWDINTGAETVWCLFTSGRKSEGWSFIQDEGNTRKTWTEQRTRLRFKYKRRRWGAYLFCLYYNVMLWGFLFRGGQCKV